MDINLKLGNVDFCCRCCAVIMNDNRILFQKRVKDKYWALPGGKIAVLETTKETIKRELKEELGVDDIIVKELLSVTENFFEWKGTKVHQYVFIHEVILNDTRYNGKEGIFKGIEKDKDIVYTWIRKENLVNSLIKPDYVREQLLNIQDGMNFFSCIE